MRSGNLSLPVQIYRRSEQLDPYRQRQLVETLWRQVWCEFTPFRGGELSRTGDVTENPTAKFRFAYLDVMAPGAGGVVLNSDMVIRHDGRVWDIDVVHIDHATKRYVEVMAIAKRLAA
ncbi:head-tail adaptor protein [uncultured Alsobacter sp.]|uniref:phage head completion protein n=1 Tax=uncultured Alsobacter sp. TaxID=1748258 RepID=UPI0025EE4F26|nr:head-tail adaptor protein [uncultured Alsobacter sp.]